MSASAPVSTAFSFTFSRTSSWFCDVRTESCSVIFTPDVPPFRLKDIDETVPSAFNVSGETTMHLKLGRNRHPTVVSHRSFVHGSLSLHGGMGVNSQEPVTVLHASVVHTFWSLQIDSTTHPRAGSQCAVVQPLGLEHKMGKWLQPDVELQRSKVHASLSPQRIAACVHEPVVGLQSSIV